MSVRPPFCLPRLSAAGPRPGSAGLRPSRPSAAALAHCVEPRRHALFARRPPRPVDACPGFDPWAPQPFAPRLLSAAGKTRIGRLFRHGARTITRLHPTTEHMNLLIASLIRILALLIALGLHGVLAMAALG